MVSKTGKERKRPQSLPTQPQFTHPRPLDLFDLSFDQLQDLRRMIHILFNSKDGTLRINSDPDRILTLDPGRAMEKILSLPQAERDRLYNVAYAYGYDLTPQFVHLCAIMASYYTTLSAGIFSSYPPPPRKMGRRRGMNRVNQYLAELVLSARNNKVPVKWVDLIDQLIEKLDSKIERTPLENDALTKLIEIKNSHTRAKRAVFLQNLVIKYNQMVIEPEP